MKTLDELLDNSENQMMFKDLLFFGTKEMSIDVKNRFYFPKSNSRIKGGFLGIGVLSDEQLYFVPKNIIEDIILPRKIIPYCFNFEVKETNVNKRIQIPEFIFKEFSKESETSKKVKFKGFGDYFTISYP